MKDMKSNKCSCLWVEGTGHGGEWNGLQFFMCPLHKAAPELLELVEKSYKYLLEGKRLGLIRDANPLLKSIGAMISLLSLTPTNPKR